AAGGRRREVVEEREVDRPEACERRVTFELEPPRDTLQRTCQFPETSVPDVLQLDHPAARTVDPADIEAGSTADQLTGGTTTPGRLVPRRKSDSAWSERTSKWSTASA